MQQYLVSMLTVPVAMYLVTQVLASLVSLALGHKTQVAEWVKAHPKAALTLRLIRSYGVDPCLVAKAFKEFAESSPTTGVPSVLVRFVYRVRAWLGLLAFALVLARCQPVKVPTANDAITAAINLTDLALSEAMIVADPPPAELPDWERRVEAVEAAARTLKAGQDMCLSLADLSTVALAIGCSKCLTFIETARAQCQ